jgi:hypothetical protein
VADNYVLVDTDVFIWLTRGKSASAAPYVRHVEGKRMVLSFATVAELWLGAELRGYGERAQRKLEADIGGAVVVRPTQDLTKGVGAGPKRGSHRRAPPWTEGAGA